jgi:hypothetical protein
VTLYKIGTDDLLHKKPAVKIITAGQGLYNGNNATVSLFFS